METEGNRSLWILLLDGLTSFTTFNLEESVSVSKVNMTQNRGPGGWRDGSAVKSTDCSYESPEFKSQQPHGSSKPYIKRSDAHIW